MRFYISEIETAVQASYIKLELFCVKLALPCPSLLYMALSMLYAHLGVFNLIYIQFIVRNFNEYRFNHNYMYIANFIQHATFNKLYYHIRRNFRLKRVLSLIPNGPLVPEHNWD